MSSGLLDSAYIGVTVGGQAPLGVTSRAAPTTGTVVLYFGGSALPSSILQLAGNFAGGFQIEIGNDAGDRGLLTFYRNGSTPVRTTLTGATINGSLSTLHALAIALDASEARWSWDGGAVQTQAYTGTPSGSGPYWVGGPSSVYPTGLYSAFRVLGEKASDADLVALTDATARAAYRIPAVASATTVVVDWHASREARGAMVRALSGTQPDILYSGGTPRAGSW